MNHKKLIAILLILWMAPSLALASSTTPAPTPTMPAVSVMTQPATSAINRRVYPNTAKTLDAMPDIARERTDTLIIGVSDLLGERNPFWAATGGDSSLCALLYDELLFTNSQGDTGAGVATVQTSTDGGTYTFTINDSVRYADGTALSSDDFINALYLLLMPGYDGVYDISRAGIVGVDAYLAGDATDISGIRRVSDRAFSVTLQNASPASLLYFAVPALRVSLFGTMQRPDTLTDPSAFDAFYAQTLLAVRDTDATEMAYGQYQFVSLTPGVSAALQRNETYWRGTPYIGTVELQVIPVGKELDMIMEGHVDIVSMLGSVEAVDTAVALETGLSFINLYTWDGDVIGYLGMDLSDPRFSDIRVRQALAIGFDRDAARKNYIERYGYVQSMLLFDSFSPSVSDIAQSLTNQYVFDAEKASALLTDAGWVIGEGGVRQKDGEPFTITLSYNTPNSIMDTVLMQIQSDYEQLGIDVKANPMPFEELVEKVAAGECEMYFQARRLPTSAQLASDLFSGDSHLNASGFDSETLARIRTMADESADAERESVLYELFYQELFLEMSVIPLYRRSEFLLVNARVMNVTVTPAHDITSDVYRFFLTDTLEGMW